MTKSYNFDTCLITGGSRGIGAAIALKLYSKVKTIYLNYHKNRNQANLICNLIHESGGRAIPIKADVSDILAVNKIIEKIQIENSKLDILIHNASLPIIPQKTLKLDWEEDILPQIEVACLGFLNCIKSANHLFVEGSKIIVILTDALFHTPPVQMGAYLTAKGALWGLVRSVAKEFQSKKISVNVVSPGMTKTELLTNYNERSLEIIANDLPLGRLAKPEEIASAIEIIIGQSGDYMHGANIVLNGGVYF
ncbi:MAG: SDR family oxidoreductase [Spirochaetota bacterium]|nr:SDR family oxidoreductase [Spirochaetota bacterium]